MKLVDFNINHYVRVKLTEQGLAIHKADHMKIFSGCLKTYPYKEPYTDHDGYSRWQLWNLMHIFGSKCYNGCNPPFETEIIIEHENN